MDPFQPLKEKLIKHRYYYHGYITAIEKNYGILSFPTCKFSTWKWAAHFVEDSNLEFEEFFQQTFTNKK